MTLRAVRALAACSFALIALCVHAGARTEHDRAAANHRHRAEPDRAACTGTAPAPSAGAPLPAPAPARPNRRCSATLPIVTDQFATVTVVPTRRDPAQRRHDAGRPAVRQAWHHRFELCARRLEPADRPRPRRQSRRHPGQRHRRRRRLGPGRGPLRAGRSAGDPTRSR